MELHAVFIDAKNNYVVIGMLYKIGKQNQFLGNLIAAGLPKLTTSAPVTVNKLDVEKAFTDTNRYYTGLSWAMTFVHCKSATNAWYGPRYGKRPFDAPLILSGLKKD
jgi:carbonic anhydrase